MKPVGYQIGPWTYGNLQRDISCSMPDSIYCKVVDLYGMVWVRFAIVRLQLEDIL